jgi:hypothetical protein
LYRLFCGEATAACFAGPTCAGVAAGRGAACVSTGRTTFSRHGKAGVTEEAGAADEADEAGAAFRELRTFIVASLLFAAWLTYGSRSLPIAVCVGRAPDDAPFDGLA